MQNDAFEQDTITEKELDHAIKEDPKTGNTMDYKLMVDLIKEVDQQYRDFREILSSNFKESYGVNSAILDDMITIKKEDITEDNVPGIRVFLGKHTIDKESKDKYEGPEKVSDEEILEIAKTLKDASNILLESKSQTEDIRDEAKPILDEYFSYLSSDRYIQIVEDKLDMLNAAIELEKDPAKRIKMEKQVKMISSTINHSYLLKRFDKYGEDEVKSIVETFFNNKKSSYIMKRYKEKITKVGFNENIYVNFLNIEETFLPENYHVFNNLFLFIYTRMIAYTDVYDKSELTIARSLTSSIAKLIYHKYDNINTENEFKAIIMSILDKFAPYWYQFEADNVTHPKHPVRIEHEKIHEQNRIDALISSCERFNIPITDEQKAMTADQLQEYFNDELDKIRKAELDAAKAEKEAKANDEATESAEGKSPLGVIKSSVDDDSVNSEYDATEAGSVETFDLSSLGINAIDPSTGNVLDLAAVPTDNVEE